MAKPSAETKVAPSIIRAVMDKTLWHDGSFNGAFNNNLLNFLRQELNNDLVKYGESIIENVDNHGHVARLGTAGIEVDYDALQNLRTELKEKYPSVYQQAVDESAQEFLKATARPFAFDVDTGIVSKVLLNRGQFSEDIVEAIKQICLKNKPRHITSEQAFSATMIQSQMYTDDNYLIKMPAEVATAACKSLGIQKQ